MNKSGFNKKKRRTRVMAMNSGYCCVIKLKEIVFSKFQRKRLGFIFGLVWNGSRGKVDPVAPVHIFGVLEDVAGGGVNDPLDEQQGSTHFNFQ